MMFVMKFKKTAPCRNNKRHAVIVCYFEVTFDSDKKNFEAFHFVKGCKLQIAKSKVKWTLIEGKKLFMSRSM